MTLRCAALSLLTLSALAASGCPDTAGRLDRFITQSEPLRLKPTPIACDGAVDASGPYFIAVAVAIQPDLPILFEGDLSVDLGAKTVRLDMHVVDYQTREPVGELLSASGTLKDSGAFTLDFGAVRVPAAGDPILHVDVDAELIFVGCTRSDSLACGLVEGTVTRPTTVGLAGSTWGADSLDGTLIGDAAVLASCEAAEAPAER